jgi:hypothetical protein
VFLPCLIVRKISTAVTIRTSLISLSITGKPLKFPIMSLILISLAVVLARGATKKDLNNKKLEWIELVIADIQIRGMESQSFLIQYLNKDSKVRQEV